MNECISCGYRWRGSKDAHHCPGCKTVAWREPGSCSIAGGTCDLCGCEFFTGLLQDNHCPNCGSKRWDHKATDARRRMEDIHPWVMEKIKTTKKGSQTYCYWMASWREGGKVKNVHLGSCNKLSKEEAMEKARALKAAALKVDDSMT